MTLPCRIGLALVAGTWAASVASAQPPDQQSLILVKNRVPAGDVVYVTDTKGATIKGRLVAATDDVVQLKMKADTRTIPAADIRRVQWRQPDSPLTGLLIGAAIGAIPGIYWLAVDPNECTGMCPEDYAAIGLGAAVGWWIDHSLSKKVAVYEAGRSNDRSKSITVSPVVRRDRKGVQIAVNF